jgi:hypothetical protein
MNRTLERDGRISRCASARRQPVNLILEWVCNHDPPSDRFIRGFITAAPLRRSGLASRAQDDYPLISRDTGPVLEDKKVEAFAERKLVTGLTPKGDFLDENIRGKVTRIVYQNRRAVRIWRFLKFTSKPSPRRRGDALPVRAQRLRAGLRA